MSSFVNWVKRHRRKFVISGAVLGGMYLLGKVAERQMAKLQVRQQSCRRVSFISFPRNKNVATVFCFTCQEEEARRILQAARKQNHFTSTENTW